MPPRPRMIELRLLGRLSLTSADGRDVRALLGQPRRLALLAYLAAATPPGFHRRQPVGTLLAGARPGACPRRAAPGPTRGPRRVGRRRRREPRRRGAWPRLRSGLV